MWRFCLAIVLYPVYLLLFLLRIVFVMAPEVYWNFFRALIKGTRKTPPYRAHMRRMGLRWSWKMTRMLRIIDVRVCRGEWPSEQEVVRIRSGPFIYICYHQSTIDTLIVPAQLHELGVQDVTWALKSSLRWVPVLGRLWIEMECVFLKRNRSQKDIGAMERLGTAASAQQAAIAYFPQGTRSDISAPKPPKIGGFVTLVRTMPGARIGSFTPAFDPPLTGGRDILRGAAFFGRTLHMHLRLHEPIREDAAALWIQEEFKRMETIIRQTGAA